jgi:hypothetical protein
VLVLKRALLADSASPSNHSGNCHAKELRQTTESHKDAGQRPFVSIVHPFFMELSRKRSGLLAWSLSIRPIAILFLLPTLSLSDCPRISQILGKGEAEVRGVLFHGCSSFSFGGAIYISNQALYPTIVDCLFEDCYSSNGGGVYISAAVILLLCDFFASCRSQADFSCGYIDLTGPASVTCSETTSTWAFTDSASTWGVFTDSESLKCQFDRGNITGCKTVMSGCGLTFQARNLVCEFYEIRSNTGTNCILLRLSLSEGTVSSIRCLSIRSNVCTGSGSYIGLFSLDVAVTVRDSLIAGNTCDYFVHSETSASGMTFASCHFDSFAFSTTGGGG